MLRTLGADAVGMSTVLEASRRAGSGWTRAASRSSTNGGGLQRAAADARGGAGGRRGGGAAPRQDPAAIRRGLARTRVGRTGWLTRSSGRPRSPPVTLQRAAGGPIERGKPSRNTPRKMPMNNEAESVVAGHRAAEARGPRRAAAMMKATTPIEVTCLVGRFIPNVSLEMTPPRRRRWCQVTGSSRPAFFASSRFCAHAARTLSLCGRMGQCSSRLLNSSQ